MITRAASIIGVLALVLWGAGCSLTKQSASDLNAGLVLVVPPQTAAEWPRATQGTTRLAAAPRVIVAWVRSEPHEGTEVAYATKANREGWIAAMRQKIEQSGLATSVMGAAPDQFDDGVTPVGVQRLAENHAADVVVLFTFDVRKRRYHAFETVAITSGAQKRSFSIGGQTNLENQMEVMTLAHGVGLTTSAAPLLSATQEGFASGTPDRRTVEELEAISKRAAVDLLAAAVVERLRLIAPEAKRR